MWRNYYFQYRNSHWYISFFIKFFFCLVTCTWSINYNSTFVNIIKHVLCRFLLPAGHCVFINGTRIESEKLVIEAGVVDLRAKDQKGKQTLNVIGLHFGFHILICLSLRNEFFLFMFFCDVLIHVYYLQVDKVILHPEYSIEHASSDLAILVVNKLRYTEYVQPICIWGPVYDKITLFGRTAMVIYV